MRTSEDGRPLYRAKEFAKRAGVTVRTLHFYDGIGLLGASRNETGHRVYGEPELEIRPPRQRRAGR